MLQPLRGQVVADYLASKADEPEWIVTGLVPADGLISLLARPKTGKSILAAQLLDSLASGTSFLDHRVVRPRRCLYVQLDCTPTEWRKQLRQLGGESWRWTTLDLDEQPRYCLDDADQRKRLHEYIAAGGFDYVVWDALEKLTKADLNPVEGMRQALDRLAEIWRGPRLLIHHPRKPSGDSIDRPSDAGAGSHYLGGEAAGTWVLTKNPTDHLKGTLSVEGRYMDKTYHLRREPGTYLWLPAPTASSPW